MYVCFPFHFDYYYPGSEIFLRQYLTDRKISAGSLKEGGKTGYSDAIHCSDGLGRTKAIFDLKFLL